MWTDFDIDALGKLIGKKLSKVSSFAADVPEYRPSTLSFLTLKDVKIQNVRVILKLCCYFMLSLRSRWFFFYEETSDNSSWYVNGCVC